MASPASGQSSTFLLLDTAFKGNLTLLKRLVAEFGYVGKKKAKTLIDVRDTLGRNILHYAAGGGNTHVCKYLIEQLKLDVNVTDKKGFSPLHTATSDKQYPTCVYLLDHGAQPNTADYKGLTPLHTAAELGKEDHICLLISKGAEVDAQSTKGTPLQRAAAEAMENALKILLDSNANPNSVSLQTHTPLVLAVLTDCVNCTKLLLKGGADPNMCSHGTTPLSVAVGCGHTNIIKCLVEAGADPNVSNFFDFKPIEMAALRGAWADVMALLEATTPIPCIPDWTVDGVFKYFNSAEAEIQRMSRAENKFVEAKAKGAEAVRRNDYLEAVHWYSEASTAKPKDATVLSNTSLCWARMNEGDRALSDALACIMLRPDWPKAYYRAGIAWNIKQNHERAVKAFESGLALDPGNKELQDAKRDAEAAMKAAPVGGTKEDDIDYADLFSLMRWMNVESERRSCV